MLQTTSSLKEFKIKATDGVVGTIKDFYFDDAQWAVRYLVVHTGSWLMGRDVLISPIALRGFDDSDKSILSNLSQEKIENSPAIDIAEPILRHHEEEYFQYYGWPYYWGGPGVWGWDSVPG